MATDQETIARKYAAISPFLDERQRRLWLAVEAGVLGHGGVSLVARATGVSRTTVTKAAAELTAPGEDDEALLPAGRVRRPGAGRKPAEVADPGVVEALEELVDPATRGDPMSPLRWTSKSTRTLAGELSQTRPTKVSAWTVAKLLRKAGYRLQANAKTREGRQHPDRDAQFTYLAERAKAFLAAGDPVISVDTKKKELVGNFANKGREWQPTGEPEEVSTHDFKGELGRANPYGVYDVGADVGWVSVGTDHDTAAFAVESIRRWWARMGQPAYPHATRLLITADGGGSNGNRNRLWKVELARLAADTGLEITVCHLPPATSKWNKIEHRMFCHISMNWRGRPLTSHEVIIETIRATTTTSGLTIDADLDDNVYPKGIKITDAQMRALPLALHEFHGDWNYTITPRTTSM
jgi:hypothetical protein